MRDLGLRGVLWGRRVKTTVPSHVAKRPLDHVNRDFSATRPNALWVADLTYVATWRGFVYVAFIIDAFARRIVGWRRRLTDCIRRRLSVVRVLGGILRLLNSPH